MMINGGLNSPLPKTEEQMRQFAMTERLRESALQVRVTALQLAVQVTGGAGHHKATLDAAKDFLSFLSADNPPSEA